MNGLHARLGRPATLRDIPDALLERLGTLGVDFLYLLSVFQTSPASRGVSRTYEPWQKEFREVLRDLTAEDIGGSGFALKGLEVSPVLGGEQALAELRARVSARGLGLVLDVVPNHVGLDHPWVREHPEYFVQGTEDQLSAQPDRYQRVTTSKGPLILAYGSDGNFVYPDTFQLNYGNREVVDALIATALKVAGWADGTRWDLAGLLLPWKFRTNWGIDVAGDPLREALAAVREQYPGHLALAETYWGDYEVLDRGFDFVYAKGLLDALKSGVVAHIQAALSHARVAEFAHFLENHDERRSAAVFPDPARHKAAAVVTLTAPGMRFLQDGQLEGNRVWVPPHLTRGPEEFPDPRIAEFYDRLLGVVGTRAFREGSRTAIVPTAPPGAPSRSYIACEWRDPEGKRYVVAVNYSGEEQWARLPLDVPETGTVAFRDMLNEGAVYHHSAADIRRDGLVVGRPRWGYHLFRVEPAR